MTANQLLDRLPAAQRRRLLELAVHRTLRSGETVATQDLPVREFMFPTLGCLSLTTSLDGHPPLQVGMLGCEGVLGAQLLLGVQASPVHAVVLQEGAALSLPALALRRSSPDGSALSRVLLRYVQVRLRLAATAAACLHFHTLQARLARWLLMGQDRAKGDGFAITQEWMAQLLGVRRVSVTVAASHMQAAGLIRYHRGWVEVGDRPGLEALACSCYAKDLACYQLGMGFLPDRHLGSITH